MRKGSCSRRVSRNVSSPQPTTNLSCIIARIFLHNRKALFFRTAAIHLPRRAREQRSFFPLYASTPLPNTCCDRPSDLLRLLNPAQ
jgi:hypothetical protein